MKMKVLIQDSSMFFFTVKHVHHIILSDKNL